jgi:hypothetical protein
MLSNVGQVFDAAWGVKTKERKRKAQRQGKAVENLRLTHKPTRHLAIFTALHRRRVNRRDDKNPPNDTTDKMRVYEDSFSGQKIYPGKVRIAAPPPTTTR